MVLESASFSISNTFILEKLQFIFQALVAPVLLVHCSDADSLPVVREQTDRQTHTLTDRPCALRYNKSLPQGVICLTEGEDKCPQCFLLYFPAYMREKYTQCRTLKTVFIEY